MAENISAEQYRILKPILLALASAPDPEEDRFITYRKQGYGNDALTEGINSIRGVMCEAIFRALNKFKDDELIAALERLTQDKTIGVRAALVYYLPLGVEPLGWDKCFSLFSHASQKGLEEYTNVAGRFLQYVPRESFQAIESLLDSWIGSRIPGLIKMTISLSSIYYLRDLLPYQKICEWLANGEIEPELKKEGLEILAHHIQFEYQVAKVLSIFEFLVSQNMPIVASLMDSIFMWARAEDFDKIRSLIENVLKLPAMLRGRSLNYLLEYLEKCLLINPRACFEILEELLNNVGEDFYNLQDYIPASHSKAPLR